MNRPSVGGVDIGDIRFLRAKTLKRRTQPSSYLIEGLYKKGDLILAIGASGTYKSFEAVDELFSIACGLPFHGCATSQGATFLLAAEGAAGMRNRLAALELDRKVKKTDYPLFISNQRMNLLDDSVQKALIGRIKRTSDKHGQPAVALVVDTLNAYCGGADENSASEMGRLMGNLARVRDELGCAIKVIHHTGVGNNSRGRGSTALRAAVDIETLYSRRKEILTIAGTKARDVEGITTLGFKPKVIRLHSDDENDRQETSIVLERIDPLAPQASKQGAALMMLGTLLHQKRSVSVADWRRAVVAQRIVNTPKAFEKLKARIVEKGQVTVTAGKVRISEA